MKKIILLSLVSFLSLPFFAQKKAIADTGEEVILYDNGTWKYVKEQVKTETPTNPTKFTKSANASFLVKSTKTNMGI